MGFFGIFGYSIQNRGVQKAVAKLVTEVHKNTIQNREVWKALPSPIVFSDCLFFKKYVSVFYNNYSRIPLTIIRSSVSLLISFRYGFMPSSLRTDFEYRSIAHAAYRLRRQQKRCPAEGGAAFLRLLAFCRRFFFRWDFLSRWGFCRWGFFSAR